MLLEGWGGGCVIHHVMRTSWTVGSTPPSFPPKTASDLGWIPATVQPVHHRLAKLGGGVGVSTLLPPQSPVGCCQEAETATSGTTGGCHPLPVVVGFPQGAGGGLSSAPVEMVARSVAAAAPSRAWTRRSSQPPPPPFTVPSLKLWECETMQIHWRRKDVGQLHHFDREASLLIPTASGRRVVSSSAGRSYGCSYVWVAGYPELLRLFSPTLFLQPDPISGDAVHLLYTFPPAPHAM